MCDAPPRIQKAAHPRAESGTTVITTCSSWPPNSASDMAAVIRQTDWSATPLGPTSDWPASLRILVVAALNSPLPTIVLWGPALVQIYNDAYRPFLGLRHPRAMGQPTQECWPEVWDFNGPIYQRVMQAGECLHLENRQFEIAPSGVREVRYLTIIHSPARDENGAIRGTTVVAIDMTQNIELAQANAALRLEARDAVLAADRHKDELLAMLGHELRNPLAPIVMAAQMLGRPGIDLQRIPKLSQIVSRQAEQMTRLVDDLLDASRVTKGLIALEREQIDIREVVANAVEQVHVLMHERHHHFTIRTLDAALLIEGDRVRLIQILGNILGNAARYTAEGSEIALDVSATDKEVELKVSDNGWGISQNFLPKVFDLFSQAERGADRSLAGLGLGLAVVRKLVALHGGSVIAHSAGLGKGSIFTVTLPKFGAPAAA